MEQCIVAVFGDRADAQQALDELVAAGFERTDVRLSEGGTRPGVRSDESLGASIKHFFTDLFGSGDSRQAQLYSEAIAHGNCVLTFDAADNEEVDRATIIIERFKPLHVDHQATTWGAALSAMANREALRMDNGIQQRAHPSARQQAQAGMQQGAQAGSRQDTQSGSQQFAPPASGAPSLSEAAQAPPSSGVKVYPRGQQAANSGAPPQGMSEDTYFRSHWSSNYAGHGNRYEDYAHAYRYGASVANRAEYRGKRWNDVEGKVRTEWETRHPGSAWEKFKVAVRHGWERITQ